MEDAERLANAALGFLDTPFRPGGHDPATGLDCLGLVVASLREVQRDPGAVPRYTTRNVHLGRFGHLARAAGLRPVLGPSSPGDILVLQPAAAQHHLAITLSTHAVIHAHAGLRRVAVGPAPLPWPVLACWRLG